MKRTYFLLLMLSLATICKGQITLNSADFPRANQYYRMSIGQAFPGMDATLTGASYSWDYSQLYPLSQRVDSFIDEAVTNPLFAIVFIDNVLNTNRANHAGRGGNFNLGTTISVNDVFNFYYNSSSSYKQVGFGATVNGIPLPVTFSPHDIQYRFPVQFGNVDSSNSGYTLDLVSTLGIYFSVRKTRVNTVDGWGTLITPFGTFDALRMKSVIREQDSIYIDSLGFGFQTPVITSTEYKWLGATQGAPLLQINTGAGGIITQITYRDSLRSLADVSSFAWNEEWQVYPSPASGQLNISFRQQTEKEIEFTLLDLQGKIVLQPLHYRSNVGENSVSLKWAEHQLAAGLYCLQLKSETGLQVRTVLVR